VVVVTGDVVVVTGAVVVVLGTEVVVVAEGVGAAKLIVNAQRALPTLFEPSVANNVRVPVPADPPAC
jgi:hypothetical protein